MTILTRPVFVRPLPKKLNMRQGRLFFRDLLKCMDGDRPRIVLDCGNLSASDKSVVLLLLHCLEEAMKRNGDVKLANVAPSLTALLEITQAKRLFEVFDTPAEAVNSFHRFATAAVSRAFLSETLQDASENAA